MNHKKHFIIVKDRHPHISEVLNDCISLCVPASRNETLASILQKICGKITSLESKITTLQTTVADLEARVEELEG